MDTVPTQAFIDQLHPEQQEILRLFDDGEARFFMLNWHRRARKTTLSINLLIRECIKHPKRIFGYIAPTYKQGKAIIWRDPQMLQRYLPKQYVKKESETELYVEFHNGSILTIKGADDPDSIRGQDFLGVALDEYALIKPEIWDEILRPIITHSADRWAIFGFTPKGQNHAYKLWNRCPDLAGWHRSFLPASKSGILSAANLESARKEMPSGLYAQEFECSFIADEERTLITSLMVDNLRQVVHTTAGEKRYVAVDPAMGGDVCVIMAFDGMHHQIAETKKLWERNAMIVVGEIQTIARKHDTKFIAIDSIGIGAPIASRLVELGYEVTSVNSSEHATNDDRYANLRAEMWWELMEDIQKREIAYPEDAELRRQISSVRFRISNSMGRLQLEGKEETKTLLGCSPDLADAFVYGNHLRHQIGKMKESERVTQYPADLASRAFSGAAGW